MEIEESNLKFIFAEGVRAVKFDETDFYLNRFKRMPSGKGIDIIAESSEYIQLIEIKNCTGDEVNNVWRTSTNNSKRSSAPRELDAEVKGKYGGKARLAEL